MFKLQNKENTMGKAHRWKYKRTFGGIKHKHVIYHIDRNKKNNDINNLIELPQQFCNLMHNKQWRLQRALSREEIIEDLSFYKQDSKGYRREVKKLSIPGPGAKYL